MIASILLVLSNLSLYILNPIALVEHVKESEAYQGSAIGAFKPYSCSSWSTPRTVERADRSVSDRSVAEHW